MTTVTAAGIFQRLLTTQSSPCDVILPSPRPPARRTQVTNPSRGGDTFGPSTRKQRLTNDWCLANCLVQRILCLSLSLSLIRKANCLWSRCPWATFRGEPVLAIGADPALLRKPMSMSTLNVRSIFWEARLVPQRTPSFLPAWTFFRFLPSRYCSRLIK